MNKNQYEHLANHIFKSSLEVHRQMGPGLLESVYEYCLEKELLMNGIRVQRQVKIPLYYKGTALDKNFRIDLLIENEILIEIKAVEYLLPVHQAQIISYLKITDKMLGFLINFNVVLLKNGFKRVVNNYFI
jgi:GxxExxY protein